MITDFAIFGLSPVWDVIVLVILALIFVFEVWMLVSALVNKVISNTAKALWILGMILIHPFVAIAYYFTDYKKTK